MHRILTSIAPSGALFACALTGVGCGDDGTGAGPGTGSTTAATSSTTAAPTTASEMTGSTGAPSGSEESSGSESSGSGPTTTGADDTSTTTGEDPTADDVVEIAIRRLNVGQDIAEFEAARDAFVDLLVLEPGVGTDREFEGLVDFGTFAAPDPAVFIGMTQYDSLDAFTAAGESLGGAPEAAAFFGTFTPEVFTPLRPLTPGDPIDLAGIASDPGQVLEVAARDLSQYQDFDEADYEAKRDAFLVLLAEQPGFVMEFQWVSAVDPNLVVGMTVYEDAAAFEAINADPAFSTSAEVADFVGGYPPLTGYLNAVVK